ncbi:MAG: hypothetical protein WDN06_07840 [Asticcacaulis sp.]
MTPWWRSGRPATDTDDKLTKFRAHDIATLRKSFEFFESEPDMINFAKLSREELEGILNNDKQDG